VNFKLVLDGDDADFFVGSRGFVGLGVGIERFSGVNAAGLLVPNENIVNTLYNVGSITFDFRNGRLQHDRIFTGDDHRASLLAISNDSNVTYNLLFEQQNENVDPTLVRESNFNIAGGGNLVLVEQGVGAIHPVVLNDDGQVEVASGVFSTRLQSSILASTLLQAANVDQKGLSGLALFEAFKTHDAVLDTNRDNAFGRANAAVTGENFRSTFTDIRINTVINGGIVRGDAFDIIGAGTDASKRQTAVEAAAVFVNIDPAISEILTASQIDG